MSERPTRTPGVSSMLQGFQHALESVGGSGGKKKGSSGQGGDGAAGGSAGVDACQEENAEGEQVEGVKEVEQEEEEDEVDEEDKEEEEEEEEEEKQGEGATMIWGGKRAPPAAKRAPAPAQGAPPPAEEEEEVVVESDGEEELRERDEQEAAQGNGEASPSGEIDGKTFRCLSHPSLSPLLISVATHQIRFEALALKEIMFPDSVCFLHGAGSSKTLKKSRPSISWAAPATTRRASGRRHLRSGRPSKS